jgi:hypothetical protein
LPRPVQFSVAVDIMHVQPVAPSTG